jgi:NADPH:quinone reductase-like Zn-dependent oxidoreductase
VHEPAAHDGEVLLEVDAAGLAIGDWLAVRGMPYIARPAYGLIRPRHHIVGFEVAGRVVAAGRKSPPDGTWRSPS